MFIGTTYICTTYILLFGLTVFLGTVFFVIIKNTVWSRFCRWCGLLELKFYNWHNVRYYVRVFEKTPKLTEAIYEVKNNKELHIKYSKGELVYTAKTKKKSGKYYLMLEEKKSKEAVCLDLDSASNLNVSGGQIMLIYTNIRVYVNKTVIMDFLMGSN